MAVIEARIIVTDHDYQKLGVPFVKEALSQLRRRIASAIPMQYVTSHPSGDGGDVEYRMKLVVMSEQDFEEAILRKAQVIADVDHARRARG